jgi:hypothetical protein
MSSRLNELFTDLEIAEKIRRGLPILFYLAELESSRAGKIGMQVGSLRENIIIALLVFKFGQENVSTDIPITETEIDVILFGQSISIKTISDRRLAGVKLIWTVDSIKAKEFSDSYLPVCDILFIHITWGYTGGIYYIPLEIQRDVFSNAGRENYIKLPTPGTNPRGVEIRKEALFNLLNDRRIKKIDILWRKPEVDFNPYQRWIDHWKEI